MNDKKYFDIHSLIVKGKEAVREYELPNGATVLIRPLTELEVEEAELAMFDAVKDKATREFAFKISNARANGETLNPDDYNDVDFSAFIRASNEYMFQVAYMAMRDFTDDFDIYDLKKIPGIKELAEEVMAISGYADETVEMVEEFRNE